MDRISTRLLVVPALAGIAFILTGAPFAARAQTPPAGPQAASQTQTFSADQLDNLVAPIALYPDPLLSQVLVASTYPLEIVEAQQWLQQNSTLRGAQLADAAKTQSWDPSVQALVAFPDVLKLLNQDVRWTTDLGNAFLAQQSDVMTAVQRMRASAKASGHLNSTAQQTVNTEMQNGQQAITIQPANPDAVYVPSYDPSYVWGAPAYGYYPALSYPSYGFGWGSAILPALYFGLWNGWGGWGWGPNWFGRTVIVNNDFFNRHGFRGDRGFGRGPWAHNPGHRLGVPYPNRQLSGRFGAASEASRANIGGFGRGPGGQPNFGRGMMPGGQPGAMPNRPGMPGMRGGASRMMPGSPGMRPMQPGGMTPGNVPRGMGPQGGGLPQGGAQRAMPGSPGMRPMQPGGMTPGNIPRAMPQGIAPQGGASRMMPSSPGMGAPRGFAPGGRGFGGFGGGGRGFGGGGFGGRGGFGGGRGGFGGGGRGGG